MGCTRFLFRLSSINTGKTVKGTGNNWMLLGTVEFAIENEDGTRSLKKLLISNNEIRDSFIQKVKPVQITMDPYFDYLDIFDADNKKRP